jgi:catechol 2,3-dioxygenase
LAEERRTIPHRLISQLAHVELLSPAPQATVDFFVDVMGLTETGRAGDSVYLRAWGEWFHHSLVITHGAQPALGHIAWRADGSEELDQAVARIIDRGAGRGWLPASEGHGPAYRFTGPGGHINEIFWEVERYRAPDALRSTYPNRPQRFSQRGVAVRQLDHTTCASGSPLADAEWYRDVLGFRLTEVTLVAERPVIAMISTNEKSHELGIAIDPSGSHGRLHHIAYWVDEPAGLLSAADALLESGFSIEWGPSRHGIGEQYAVYTREPGGIRIEITTGGYRIYQPDWEPIYWTPDQGSREFYRPRYETDPMTEMFPPLPVS